MSESMTPSPADMAQDRSTEHLAEVLGVLDTLDDRPVVEHVAVYGAVHEALQAVLAEPER